MSHPCVFVCRCCSHSDVSSHRMSPCRPEELGLQLCRHANETRVQKRDRLKVQEEDRGYGSVSDENVHTSCFLCPSPSSALSWPLLHLYYIWILVFDTPQTSRYIRAGGGNHSMSLLWIPAGTERAALHLLQEQPALLHCHGTNNHWHINTHWTT